MYTWMLQPKPINAPLTPTMRDLLTVVHQSDTTTFDASAWNIRTVWALWNRGLIYTNCNGTYKVIALTPAGQALFAPLAVETPETTAAEAVDSTLRVEPLGPIAHLGQLVGATVQAEVFDDPVFRHKLYVGEITDAKEGKGGKQVYFKTADLIGGKWLPLSKVRGLAWFETQKATA